MDPLGFALEHFNAIGQWRDKETPLVSPETESETNDGKPIRRNRNKTDGLDIDATGVMPDGARNFDGHEQMKSLLLDESEGLAKGVMKSMLTYALGRRVGFADGDYVKRLHGQWKQEGYGMRELIHAIVQSTEFQTK